MNTISFMSANFVARQVGYHMTKGWGQGERATNEYFRPLETFGPRFEELLTAVRAMGFATIDIWTAHLNWAWATDRHIAIARDLLDRHALAVASLAGGFGATADQFDAACRLAVALQTRVLGGSAPFYDAQRDAAIATLDRHDRKLGIENHPGVETPEQMLAKIGDGGHGRIGTTVDTGWYGTVGLDAARAIEQLGAYIFHVHLKDVRAPGSHETCRYGQGVVPVRACVEALHKLGYQGAISVEHEPEAVDPTDDCKANLAMLRASLSAEPCSTGGEAMITGIGHVAFRVTDLERALDFYCDKLGFREAFRLDREGEPSPWIVYLQIGPGQFVELFPGARELGPQPGAAAGYNHLCLLVDDMDATLRQLAERGLAITGAPRQGLDHNWQYWLTDPDGNRIELMQIMPESPQATADARWSST